MEEKRMKNVEKKVLVTHNGTFHADDVFAYAVLKMVFPNHELIRSRNSEIWEKGDIVFDVGGGKYDHHNVDKVYRDNNIPYASFGLIWKAYGKQYLSTWLKDNELEEAHKKIDTEFIQAIDALDNGENLIQDSPIKVNTVSDIIYSFNNQVNALYLAPEKIEEYQDNYFAQASYFAGKMLENEVLGVLSNLRGKEKVKKAFEQRENKALVVLDESHPWEDSLWELDTEKEVLYVVYPKPDGYYIQVMRKNKTTFDARKDLPVEWAGKRGNELGEIVGINDAIFCHSALFLAGAKSKESILKMAEIALSKE